MKRHFFTTLAALAALSGAQAANLDFTYNFDKAAPETLGYDKTETYDVALLATDKEGFPASVPAAIEAGKEYTFSYTFDLSDIENELCRQNPDRMRVIAVLLDAGGGKIVNSNSSAYPDGTPFVGIEAAETATDAAEIARYAIDGTRLSVPAHGINIIRYADGTVRKVLVR